MAKASFSTKIINNYKKVLAALYEAGLICRSNELSEKGNDRKKTLEFCTKNQESNCLFDTSLPALEMYSKLYTSGQYNFEFKDGSILLFQCEVEGAQIIKQRIVYIKPYSVNVDFNDEDSWEKYQMSDQKDNLLSFPILFRIDYNKNETKDDHPISHMTLSNVINCRIPIKANLELARFVEFIVQQFYDNTSITIPMIGGDAITIRNEERNKVHINWER